MSFAIHCDEEVDVKVPRKKSLSKEAVPGVKQRLPLCELSNGLPAINVIKPEHEGSENSQQSYQCQKSFSIFEETEETVIYNAHLVNQVHIKPLELFEKETVMKPNYLELSKIKPSDRTFLIDWIVKIHKSSKLSHKCLFLSVVTIDRFLQVDVDIMECDLQLVGLASLCIASECEDDEQNSNETSVNVQKCFRKAVFMYSALSGYSEDELIRMDNRIHEALGLTLLVPHYFVSLHLHFLENFVISAKLVYDWFDDRHETLAKYLLELSLQEYEFCHHLPSQLAAASLCLSLKITGDRQTSIDVLWNLSSLVSFSRYTYNILEPLVKKMCLLIMNSETSMYQAIQKKYLATHLAIRQAAKTFYESDDAKESPSTSFSISRGTTSACFNNAFLSPNAPFTSRRSSSFIEIIDISFSP
uniref:Uncharacterized protein n=1 Tax=Daphnia galeata TaxID=27404 RepID=A0A8J2S8T5_9CRUS|nr:unnamed protein product [Daphnia galeata]